MHVSETVSRLNLHMVRQDTRRVFYSMLLRGSRRVKKTYQYLNRSAQKIPLRPVALALPHSHIDKSTFRMIHTPSVGSPRPQGSISQAPTGEFRFRFTLKELCEGETVNYSSITSVQWEKRFLPTGWAGGNIEFQTAPKIRRSENYLVINIIFTSNTHILDSPHFKHRRKTQFAIEAHPNFKRRGCKHYRDSRITEFGTSRSSMQFLTERLRNTTVNRAANTKIWGITEY